MPAGTDDLLRLIVEASQDAILVHRPDGAVAYASAPVQALLGHRPDDLAGRRLEAYVHGEDRGPLEELWRELGRGLPVVRQFRLRAADGTFRWVDCSASPRLEDGAPRAFVLVLRDEEERRAARDSAWQALREKERYVEAVFDNALDPFAILDAEGVVVDANPAAVAFLGAPREAVLGRAVFHFARAAGEDLPQRWRGFLATGKATGELELATAAGARVVEFSLTANVLPGLHLAAFRDVTDRRQLQARLAMTDRLATMGTVAAGVAHEVKNPLAYVAANLEYLEGGLAELAGRHPAEAADLRRLSEAAREALTGVSRIESIVRDLKTFSRADDGEAAISDVRRVLESCVNMAWADLKRRATLRKELRPVPPVRAAEARLGQVFLNLVVNAVQAIPEADPRRHEVGIATRPTPEGNVEVSVWDTGVGIPERVRARIFEPFFTTKRPGEGTGLGLSIVKSIVESAGGTISVESEPGKGSRFTVVLPAADLTSGR